MNEDVNVHFHAQKKLQKMMHRGISHVETGIKLWTELCWTFWIISRLDLEIWPALQHFQFNFSIQFYLYSVFDNKSFL